MLSIFNLGLTTGTVLLAVGAIGLLATIGWILYDASKSEAHEEAVFVKTIVNTANPAVTAPVYQGNGDNTEGIHETEGNSSDNKTGAVTKSIRFSHNISEALDAVAPLTEAMDTEQPDYAVGETEDVMSFNGWECPKCNSYNSENNCYCTQCGNKKKA